MYVLLTVFISFLFSSESIRFLLLWLLLLLLLRTLTVSVTKDGLYSTVGNCLVCLLLQTLALFIRFSDPPSVYPSLHPSVHPSSVPPSGRSVPPSLQLSVRPSSLHPSGLPSISPSFRLSRRLVRPPSVPPSVRLSLPSWLPPPPSLLLSIRLNLPLSSLLPLPSLPTSLPLCQCVSQSDPCFLNISHHPFSHPFSPSSSFHPPADLYYLPPFPINHLTPSSSSSSTSLFHPALLPLFSYSSSILFLYPSSRTSYIVIYEQNFPVIHRKPSRNKYIDIVEKVLGEFSTLLLRKQLI